MAARRRKYSTEFKLDAVRMVVDRGLKPTEVAKDLGIDRSLLSAWKKSFEEGSLSESPGNGRLTPEAEEIRRLRKELSRVTEERDILGKALAYFSKEQK